MTTFPVRAYRPYVVDFVWVLNVPAETQEKALEMAAAVQEEENATYPDSWVVTDFAGNEETSIVKDCSGQKAFVWSADYREVAHITPADQPCIPHVGHTMFGVLIAEKVSGPSTATSISIPSINAGDLRDGRTGQRFVTKDKCIYRVVWAFTNPQ